MDNKQTGHKFGTGIFLLTVSILLTYIVGIIGVLVGLYYSFYNNHIGNGFLTVDSKMRKLAIMIDQTGNILCHEWFNKVLIQADSIAKFGITGETVSSVLGKNERDDTLKPLGKWLVKQLNKIEKDHCLKSINQ